MVIQAKPNVQTTLTAMFENMQSKLEKNSQIMQAISEVKLEENNKILYLQR